MKKLFNILIVLGLLFSSCENFIEEDNRSDVGAAEFYATAKGYQTLIDANYSQLREIYGDVPWLFCRGTDIYSGGRGAQMGIGGLSTYNDLDASSDNVEDLYENCYVAIQTANTAIYYSEITEETDKLTEQVGEVKFLRALSYFLLVETYGGIPIVEEYIQSPMKEFGRDSEGDVYNFILQDLSDAATALVASTEPYTGKVNLRAVKHLQGLVYLTRAYKPDISSASDFSTAADLFNEVIDGQQLPDDYAALWTMDNQLNEETIFSVGFSEASQATSPTDIGNRQYNFFGPYMGGTENAHSFPLRTYDLIATPAGLGLFTEDDDRFYATFMVEMFADTNRSDGGGYFDYYRQPNRDLVTVIYYCAPYWLDQDSIDAYQARYPDCNIIPFEDHTAHDGLEHDFVGIAVKKFDDPVTEHSSGDRSSTKDLIVFRLADAYLLYAEALYANGTGSSADALVPINAVRERANTTLATVGDIDIDYILDERARELWGEYKRWFDLKRTGKLVERASRDNWMIEESYFEGKNGELKILRPIPQKALDLNQSPDFQQNPAY